MSSKSEMETPTDEGPEDNKYGNQLREWTPNPTRTLNGVRQPFCSVSGLDSFGPSRTETWEPVRLNGPFFRSMGRPH